VTTGSAAPGDAEVGVGDVLWRPSAEARSRSRLASYMTWLEQRGRRFDDYESLRAWSVDEPRPFWQSIWEYFDVQSSAPFAAVMSDDPMPDTRWFVGARLNYAEHALAHGGSSVALLGRSQTREPVDVTYDELRDQVGRARAGLIRAGVERGDAVVAYLPNVPECVVLFLAAASIGATFASCSPEFGTQSVVDRFTQLHPKVLVTVDGYRHHGKPVDKRQVVEIVRSKLPELTHTVHLPYLGDDPIEGALPWSQFMANPEPLLFEQVDVDHPVYVLFSSGTTGIPKAIVHGHGRILVEHLKTMGLQLDLGAEDRLLAPATTSWMVWNFGISALALGGSLVCFDGDPLWPTPVELWRVAEETRATIVNTGAAVLLHAMKAGHRPGDEFDLSTVRSISSTGSPLPAEGFRWVYDAVKKDVSLASGSGGTDLCSGFVGGSPLHPVTAGEIACRFLGAPVEAFDPTGQPVRNEPGELVLTAPMPSMPVAFLGDPDKELYRRAYFDMFPNTWRHGDWITITDRGTCVISGRSDATLNRAGVRIGTAELYSVVDALPTVNDSAVVHLEDPAGGAGSLILLVVPAEGVALDDEFVRSVKTAIRAELSPRHVPDEVHLVRALPRTLTGKKLEVPLKKILLGGDPDTLISKGAVTNPQAVDEVVSLARERRGSDATLTARGVA
jgi:acetoacetyl-CoA synthetase